MNNDRSAFGSQQAAQGGQAGFGQTGGQVAQSGQAGAQIAQGVQAGFGQFGNGSGSAVSSGVAGRSAVGGGVTSNRLRSGAPANGLRSSVAGGSFGNVVPGTGFGSAASSNLDGFGGGAGQNQMGYTGGGMAPVSSGTGDVILSSDGGGRKSKKWLVVAVITLVMFGIGGATIFAIMGATGGIGGSRLSLEESWDKYYNLLMYGPPKEDGSENNVGAERSINNWYPAVVGNVVGTNEAYIDYYNKLGEVYSDFRVVAEKKEVVNIDAYTSRVVAFVAFNTLSKVKDDLTKRFLGGGRDGAQSYVEELFGEPTRSDAMNVYMKQYLEDNLNLIEIYNSYGCYGERVEFAQCVAQINSEEKSEYLERSSIVYNNMASYYRKFFAQDFFDWTMIMNNAIGERNE